MNKLISGIYLFFSVMYCSSLYSFFIINSSNSKKQLAIAAYLPLPNDGDHKREVIFKKELNPHEMIEAPFALREVSLDLHWGEEKTTPSQDIEWKSIEKQSDKAATWQTIGSLRYETRPFMRHVVIPPTWHLQEDSYGITVITDIGEKITATTRDELLAKIPYRRLTDTLPQTEIITSDPQKAAYDWQKIGTNRPRKQELVIPRSWIIEEHEHETIITTDSGKKHHIPVSRITGENITLSTQDLVHLQRIIPFRRKNNVILSLQDTEHFSIVEEAPQKKAPQKPFQTCRCFKAEEASSDIEPKTLPDRIGRDHIFEIEGSGYATDIKLLYEPEKEPTRGLVRSNNRIKESLENNENNYQKVIEKRDSLVASQKCTKALLLISFISKRYC